MKAIKIQKNGGPEVLELKDVTLAGQAGEEVSVSTASYEVSFVTPQKTSLSENYPNGLNVKEIPSVEAIAKGI